MSTAVRLYVGIYHTKTVRFPPGFIYLELRTILLAGVRLGVGKNSFRPVRLVCVCVHDRRVITIYVRQNRRNRTCIDKLAGGEEEFRGGGTDRFGMIITLFVVVVLLL